MADRMTVDKLFDQVFSKLNKGEMLRKAANANWPWEGHVEIEISHGKIGVTVRLRDDEIGTRRADEHIDRALSCLRRDRSEFDTIAIEQKFREAMPPDA